MAPFEFIQPIGANVPRIISGHEKRPIQFQNLVEELADELKNSRSSGQPVIYEQRFPKSEAIRTTVIWDKWAQLSDDDRYATILQAYETVEGEEFRERIALVSGLTVPEAYSEGMLPIQITTALRNSDPFTIEQCHEAMVNVGASQLADTGKPVLRCSNVDEAEHLVNELVRLLPGSKPIWVISQEVAKIIDF